MTCTILHIAAFPPSGAGGVERTLIDYLLQVGDGNRHVLCAIDPSDEMEVTLRSLPVETHVLRRASRLDIRLILKIANTIKEVSPDIVYSRGFTGFLWSSLAIIRKKNIKLIRGEHGSTALQTGVQKPLDWFLTRRFDKVIANSEAVKSTFARNARFPLDKIRVVHNGVDVRKYEATGDSGTLRQSLKIEATAPVVGTVANFHPWKDNQTLVRAIPIVLHSIPDAVFVMVGTGSQLEPCRELAISLGVESSTRFPGSQENAPEYHAMFDIFVLPSIYESFGNVLVEAGMAGKPVVAGRVGGIQEIVEDGVTGVLLQHTVSLNDADGALQMAGNLVDLKTGTDLKPKRLDPDALAEAITSLLKDGDRSKSLGKAARKRAIANFSLERYSDNLAAVYSEVLSS